MYDSLEVDDEPEMNASPASINRVAKLDLRQISSQKLPMNGHLLHTNSPPSGREHNSDDTDHFYDSDMEEAKHEPVTDSSRTRPGVHAIAVDRFREAIASVKQWGSPESCTAVNQDRHVGACVGASPQTSIQYRDTSPGDMGTVRTKVVEWDTVRAEVREQMRSLKPTSRQKHRQLANSKFLSAFLAEKEDMVTM
jgi:hypothetical protein